MICVSYCPVHEHLALAERTSLVGQGKVSWWWCISWAWEGIRRGGHFSESFFLGHSGCLPAEDKALSVSAYCHKMQCSPSADFNSSRSSPVTFVTAEAPFSTSLLSLAASGKHLRPLGWSHNNEAFVASSILGEEAVWKLILGTSSSMLTCFPSPFGWCCWCSDMFPGKENVRYFFTMEIKLCRGNNFLELLVVSLMSGSLDLGKLQK